MRFAPFFHLFRDKDVFVCFLIVAALLQVVSKTVTARSASTKALLGYSNVVRTDLKTLPLFHLFSVASCLIKRKAIIAHVVSATGSMISFAVQTLTGAFTSYAKAAGLGSLAQMIDPHLYFDHELREIKVLRSCAEGYAPLKQRRSFEASIGLLDDGPDVVLYRTTQSTPMLSVVL